jgi:hypothetical protein
MLLNILSSKSKGLISWVGSFFVKNKKVSKYVVRDAKIRIYKDEENSRNNITLENNAGYVEEVSPFMKRTKLQASPLPKLEASPSLLLISGSLNDLHGLSNGNNDLLSRYNLLLSQFNQLKDEYIEQEKVYKLRSGRLRVRNNMLLNQIRNEGQDYERLKEENDKLRENNELLSKKVIDYQEMGKLVRTSMFKMAKKEKNRRDEQLEKIAEQKDDIEDSKDILKRDTRNLMDRYRN